MNKLRVCLSSILFALCAGAASAPAARGKDAGGPPPVVAVRRFACESTDPDAWWIAITSQRKLIEWLAGGGMTVASALTPLPDSLPEPSCAFHGSVTLDDTIATLAVELRSGKNVECETRLSAGKTSFRRFRNVLGQIILYGLGVEQDTPCDKSLAARPAASNYAFGLYLLAQRKLAAGKTGDAIALLEESFARDSTFAMACWTIAEILKESKPDTAMQWAAMARHINPGHPRWRFRDPQRDRDPLPGLLAACGNTSFSRVRRGLSCRHAVVTDSARGRENRLEAIVWIADPRRYSIEVCAQTEPSGNRIAGLHKHCNALVSINGGFFDVDRELRLIPSGLVVSGGTTVSPVLPEGGSGVFFMNGTTPGIMWARDVDSAYHFDYALQCGPVIVEPGGMPGVYSNNRKRVNRSAVGITRDSSVVIAIVYSSDGPGLSLYEFAGFLRAPGAQGGCGCDAALNLDGGSSTQLRATVKDTDMHVTGLWAVSNAIVIRDR
ncbi:MAG: hypothetical protein GF418_13760 [Chitinivibrionales bacterium]|nr:hypothetical protein [Chitinivibrionales bacterium]MBD3396687.1 hypothetical protein [Chitinivibrionales bacterium]